MFGEIKNTIDDNATQEIDSAGPPLQFGRGGGGRSGGFGGRGRGRGLHKDLKGADWECE
jgi:hypothetical protein